MQKARTTRRRSLLTVGILFLALASYSVFMPPPDGRASILHQELFSLFRPLHMAAVSVGSGVTSFWNHYVNLLKAAEENDQLRQQLAALQTQLSTTQDMAAENTRLRGLLAMGTRWTASPIAARVIATTSQPDVHTIVIDQGWADGVQRDRPVMSGAGLVGRIRVLTEHTATVLLLTDPSSAVDVIDSRSRVRGLLVGAVYGTSLQRSVALTQLEYVSHDSDIHEEDELMTSGMDGVYPKGLPVGKVREVKRGEHGLFEEAWVLPLADMTRLEEVLVL